MEYSSGIGFICKGQSHCNSCLLALDSILIIFNSGILYNHMPWGEFGSIVGVIVELTSFIGYPIDVLQSKMGIASEGRASFFKMFAIILTLS